MPEDFKGVADMNRVRKLTYTLYRKGVMKLEESEIGTDSVKYIPVCDRRFSYLSN